MAYTLQIRLKEKPFIVNTLKSGLILFYIFDSINKYLLVSGNNFSASIIIRSVYELIFLGVIILFVNKERFYFLLCFLLLYAGFVIGQFAFKLNYEEEYNFIFHTTIFIKYTFIFVIYFAAYKIVKSPEAIQVCRKILEWIFIINSSLAIIGLIFDLQLLKSYYMVTFRFGYNGFIPAINEATLFYALGMFYYYHKYFIKNIKDKKAVLFFISCFIVGAKGLYLMIVLLSCYHFVTTTSKRIMSNVVIVMSFVAVTFFLYLTTEDAQNRFEYFFRIAQENGIVTMLLSGRDIAIEKNVYENMKSWNLLNYLFGGQDQGRLIIEMDFIDMFLLFGIIGSIIYLYLLFKTIFSFRKTSFNKFFIFGYLFLAAFGGHFFPSAVNAIYVVIFCLSLKYDSQLMQEEKRLEI